MLSERIRWKKRVGKNMAIEEIEARLLKAEDRRELRQAAAFLNYFGRACGEKELQKIVKDGALAAAFKDGEVVGVSTAIPVYDYINGLRKKHGLKVLEEMTASKANPSRTHFHETTAEEGEREAVDKLLAETLAEVRKKGNTHALSKNTENDAVHAAWRKEGGKFGRNSLKEFAAPGFWNWLKTAFDGRKRVFTLCSLDARPRTGVKKIIAKN